MLLPFIGLIFVALIAYLIMMQWVITRGQKKYGKGTARTIALAVAVSVPVLIVAYKEITTPNIEWNPKVETEQIIGEWLDGSEQLTIKDNHVFILRVEGDVYSGEWALNNWNLDLISSASAPYSYLRVIYYSDEYHLAKIRPKSDPDTWIYNDAFDRN